MSNTSGDGAGLHARGRITIRASVDGLHHPEAVRYRKGDDLLAPYVVDAAGGPSTALS